jgi:hypothetical protein
VTTAQLDALDGAPSPALAAAAQLSAIFGGARARPRQPSSGPLQLYSLSDPTTEPPIR